MGTYDFFISYKWSTYAPQAKELRNIARKNGYRTWLDIDHDFQPPAGSPTRSDEALAKHLKDAIASCSYILFFETFATMAMQVGGPPIRVTSWQERELGFAASKKLITLYHGASPKALGFGSSMKLHEYRDLEDAFTMIKSAISNSTGGLWS